MKTLVIIPSRLSAERLPGKPLMKIKGLSIISHVFKKAEEANIGEVIVAAEDQEIVDDVKQNGGQAILTKNEHKTGTDRIYEVFQKINSTFPTIFGMFSFPTWAQDLAKVGPRRLQEALEEHFVRF